MDLAVPTGALISSCGTYRYVLWRTWKVSREIVNFVMLNPSTADAETDDPTIRRCVAFAKRWGYGGIVVTNLYAYRASSPKALFFDGHPIGLDNERHLKLAARAASRLVVAWGVRGAFNRRGSKVATLLQGIDRLSCLGVTKNGEPRHPLYIPKDTDLVRYRILR